MIPAVYKVVSRIQESPDVFTVTLSPDDGVTHPHFEPGQFNMLYPFGAGEVPISISGDPQNQGHYVHTVRSLGAATRALERLETGQSVGVRGPFGRGWPLEKVGDKQPLVLAGGLGLAPLRPLIYGLNHRTSPTSPMKLFYGARTPKDILFADELDTWRTSADIHVSVDQVTPGDNWQGHVGVVTQLLQNARLDGGNAIAFICGPEIMMRFSIAKLLEKGVPENAIYLSMERNMQCATGNCGHCQWGPNFVCKDGPVFCYEDIKQWWGVREL